MNAARRTTLRMESLESRTVPATFYVSNLNDTGAGSFRQAIIDANTNGTSPAQDRIEFRGLNPGRALFFPQSPLPPILQPVVIAGDTQTGYDGSRPIVEISGLHAGPSADGLQILKVNQVIVRGLVIDSFTKSGIYLEDANNVKIQGCYIGTDYAGESHSANLISGIFARNSSANTIGTDQDGINDLSERNVISGNRLDGITMVGGNSSGNSIVGNYLETVSKPVLAV